MTLGKYIKLLRLDKKLTLREVEELAGVSNAYLSQLEHDKIKSPSVATLYRIADFLGGDFMFMVKLTGVVSIGEYKALNKHR